MRIAQFFKIYKICGTKKKKNRHTRNIANFKTMQKIQVLMKFRLTLLVSRGGESKLKAVFGQSRITKKMFLKKTQIFAEKRNYESHFVRVATSAFLKHIIAGKKSSLSQGKRWISHHVKN